MRSLSFPAAVLLAALPPLLSGCPRKETPASDAPPAASPSHTAASRAALPLASMPTPSSRPASPPPSGSAALDPAAQAQADRYLKALGRGRKLTVAKKFAEAVGAFNEALREVPGDARATAERGYARLQSDDLDGAERDFYEALDRKPDRAVLSAVTYNLALVAEKRGNEALASELKEAAKTNKKPARRSTCAGSVERSAKSMDFAPETKTLQTLRQVRGELARYATDHAITLEHPLPTTNEETELKALLLGDAPSPWRFTTGADVHLLFRLADSYLLHLGAGTMNAYRCGSVTDIQVDLSGNPSVTVRDSNGMVGYMCASAKSDQPRPCSEVQGDGWEPVQSFCGEGFYNSWTTLYDRSSGQFLLQIHEEQPNKNDNPPSWATISKRPEGVQLLGNGCNELVKYTK